MSLLIPMPGRETAARIPTKNTAADVQLDVPLPLSRYARALPIRIPGWRRLAICLAFAAIGFTPIGALALTIGGLWSLTVGALVLIVPAIVAAVILGVCYPRYGRFALEGLAAGLAAVLIYDLVRWTFVAFGLWGDFIPNIGGWLNGTGRAGLAARLWVPLAGRWWRHGPDVHGRCPHVRAAAPAFRGAWRRHRVRPRRLAMPARHTDRGAGGANHAVPAHDADARPELHRPHRVRQRPGRLFQPPGMRTTRMPRYAAVV